MDSNDFERVFKRNKKRLFLIALSFTANQYDAEDILQNSFMKLLKAKTEFKDDEHIDKWLTSVTVNESKNLLKSAFRKRITLQPILLKVKKMRICSMLLCLCLKNCGR